MQISFPSQDLMIDPDAKIAVIFSQFNQEYSEKLLESCIGELEKQNIPKENIKIFSVPGAFEIPYAAQKILLQKKYDGIITLGVVIRGETNHYDLVCENVARGISELNMHSEIPVVFGVLTCENVKQVEERLLLGKYFSRSVLEMISFGVRIGN